MENKKAQKLQTLQIVFENVLEVITKEVPKSGVISGFTRHKGKKVKVVVLDEE